MKIILDLECTCTDTNEFPREEMEIIEIGAILFDNQGREVSRFQTFIKPVKHSKLTDFCKKLTTITQEEVDSAPNIQEAFEQFDAWVEQAQKKYEVKEWLSWGFFDKNTLQNSQKTFKLTLSSLNKLKHSNASLNFKRKYGLERKMGVGKALKFLNLKFEGTQHRAIDDVINIAKIVYH